MVVHCVAIINPDVCERDPLLAQAVNAESVRWAVELAGAGRLVYVSSDYVFDGRIGGYTEKHPPAPVNVYGETKRRGEEYALGAARPLVARLALFGAGLPVLPRTRIEDQLLVLSRGEEVTAATDQIGTPLWANTAAAVLLRLIENGVSGIVHAAGQEAVSKAGLLDRLAACAGIQHPQVRGLPTADLKPAAPRPLNVALRPSPSVTALPEYPPWLDAECQRYCASLLPVLMPSAKR